MQDNYCNSPAASQLQRSSQAWPCWALLAASPTAILNHKWDKGVEHHQQPRDRLARCHVSIKLGGLLTLTSCKTRDSGTPAPDRGTWVRGVPPVLHTEEKDTSITRLWPSA